MLLAKLNWPEMEVEIVKRKEEPEMLLLNVIENGLPAAAVFVRNSGTEDKLALYLRGRKELEVRLESLAEKISWLLDNPISASKMGLSGQKIIGDRWELTTMVREIQSLYVSLLSQKKIK